MEAGGAEGPRPEEMPPIPKAGMTSSCPRPRFSFILPSLPPGPQCFLTGLCPSPSPPSFFSPPALIPGPPGQPGASTRAGSCQGFPRPSPTPDKSTHLPRSLRSPPQAIPNLVTEQPAPNSARGPGVGGEREAVSGPQLPRVPSWEGESLLGNPSPTPRLCRERIWPA